MQSWLGLAAQSPYALLIAVAAFAVLAFAGVPQIVLIAAAAVAFGPWWGSVYSWVGTLVSAAIGFWLGRMLGARALRRFGGERLQSFIDMVGRNGFLASMIIRLVPSAPFAVLNMAAGVTPMRFSAFAAGTAVGVAPKIALIVLAGHWVAAGARRQAVDQPRPAGPGAGGVDRRGAVGAALDQAARGGDGRERTMIKLFYVPGGCSRVPHIALEEAGATFEAVLVDFSVGEQRSPDYLAINPKGRVPALVTERGVLSETPAILAWIAQTWPEARLAPLDDPWAFAQMQAFNSYMASTVHVAHAHRNRGARWAEDEAAIAHMHDYAPRAIADAFALIETEFLKGPWVLGEDYSVCDPYLFVLSGWLPQRGVDPAQFPRIAEHRRRMAERPAVQRAIAREEAPAR